MKRGKSASDRDARATMKLYEVFNHATRKVALIAGKPATIAACFALVVVWALLGPFLGFSDAWQLTINTATTIVTFLMVFIIQNSQNRDGLAVQIKLNELLRSQTAAQNVLFDLEELSEEELEELRQKYEALPAAARRLKQERRGVLPIELKLDHPPGADKPRTRARRKRPGADAQRSKA